MISPRPDRVIGGLLAIAAVVLTILPAAAQKNPASGAATATVTPVALPTAVAGFQRGGFKDFEPESPGLGYSYAYDRSGWGTNVYVYDLKKIDIPSDPRSGVITSQLEQAKGDVLQAQKDGNYTNVAFRSEFDIADGASKPMFRCVSMGFERRDAGAVDSYLCIAGYRGKFVKVRMTTRAQSGTEATVRQFVGALAKALPAN